MGAFFFQNVVFSGTSRIVLLHAYVSVKMFPNRNGHLESILHVDSVVSGYHVSVGAKRLA